MAVTLSKREFYAKTSTRKYKLEWVVFWGAAIINALCIIVSPGAIVATLSCAICGFFLNKTMDKRWGIVLLVMGVISTIMMGFTLGMGVVMIVNGLQFYRVFEHLDKAYAQYLESGVVPDFKGL